MYLVRGYFSIQISTCTSVSSEEGSRPESGNIVEFILSYFLQSSLLLLHRCRTGYLKSKVILHININIYVYTYNGINIPAM